MDAGLAGWLADVEEPVWREPDWSEDPVYAAMLPASERLARLVAPAVRPTGELASLDPEALSAAERIDLAAALQEQLYWLAAVQARVLGVIDAADTSRLGLSQEAVSLALKVPPQTAQRMLKTARALVRELPKTLGLLAAGEISARHAQLIAEAAWRLEPELAGQFEARVTGRAGDTAATPTTPTPGPPTPATTTPATHPNAGPTDARPNPETPAGTAARIGNVRNVRAKAVARARNTPAKVTRAQ